MKRRQRTQPRRTRARRGDLVLLSFPIDTPRSTLEAARERLRAEAEATGVRFLVCLGVDVDVANGRQS